MHVFVIAPALETIRQAGLHAALGGDGMRALGRHQRKDQRLQAAPFRRQGDPLPGQPAADDQHVGVNKLHDALLCQEGIYGSPTCGACSMPSLM